MIAWKALVGVGWLVAAATAVAVSAAAFLIVAGIIIIGLAALWIWSLFIKRDPQ